MPRSETHMAYDSNGRPLINPTIQAGDRSIPESPIWPPVGYNLVAEIPGRSIRDNWPKEGGKGQVMNRGTGGEKDIASQLLELSKLKDQGEMISAKFISYSFNFFLCLYIEICYILM